MPAGSWCRTRRPSSSHCSPARCPDRACWTPARRLAARRRRSRRPIRRRWSSRATCGIGAWPCCGGPSARPAPRTSRSSRPIWPAPLPFPDRFDCVMVDAPCSGLGTLRRDPDIRWRRTEADLPPLAAAQLTMLRHAAAAVAPGGRLVYATCSSEPEENEDVVGGVPRGRRRVRAGRCPRRRIPRCRRKSSTSAATCGPSRIGTASRRSSAPCFEALMRFVQADLMRVSASGRRLSVEPTQVAVVTILTVHGLRNARVGARASSSCSAEPCSRPTCLFAAASMRLALRAREVQVPDLINRTANEATTRWRRPASASGWTTRGASIPRSPAGRVVAQDPPPARPAAASAACGCG